MGNNIILIEPASSGYIKELSSQRYNYPPMGIMYLSSFLEMHGYSVTIIDLFLERFSKESFKQYLKKIEPTPILVGMTTYTDSFYECIEIASLIKQVYPQTKIVLGGPHATFCVEECLSHPEIDFVVKHEGENTLIELLEHLKYPTKFSVKKVKGLCYKENGTCYHNPARKFIRRLDYLPFPAYHKLNLTFYGKMFTFISSRGCPGECVFCSSRVMSGGTYRFHSAEWLFSLLMYYYSKLKFVAFECFDDTFTASPRRVFKFCSYINHSGIKFFWGCKSRVDIITEKMAKVIGRSGCRTCHVGIESGDATVLESLKKRITMREVFESLRILTKHNITPRCSFIIGHHTDTKKTIMKTLKLMKFIEKKYKASVVVSTLTPFPGTYLLENVEQLGLDISTQDWSKYNLMDPIFSTKNFTLDEIREIAYNHIRYQN